MEHRPMRAPLRYVRSALLAAALGAGGCAGGDSDSTSTVGGDVAADQAVEDSSSETAADVDTPGLDPTLFLSDALVSAISMETCVLSAGTETTCYRIEIKGAPADQEIGPFCPPTIYSDATEGGI